MGGLGHLATGELTPGEVLVQDGEIEVTVKDGDFHFGSPQAQGLMMTRLSEAGLNTDDLEAHLRAGNYLDPANSEHARSVRVLITDLLAERAAA